MKKFSPLAFAMSVGLSASLFGGVHFLHLSGEPGAAIQVAFAVLYALYLEGIVRQKIGRKA